MLYFMDNAIYGQSHICTVLYIDNAIYGQCTAKHITNICN